jgi:hypothetical protein
MLIKTKILQQQAHQHLRFKLIDEIENSTKLDFICSAIEKIDGQFGME